MKRLSIMMGLWTFVFLGLQAVQAAPSEYSDEIHKALAVQESPEDITYNDEGRQLGELARSIASLNRRMDRMEEHLDQLDRDLKELKRKI